jgi:hypothetical protein
MGSLPPRLVAVALFAIGLGLVAAPARAETDGAVRTASAFVDALARQDGAAACALFTPGALERLGGAEKCRSSFSPSASEADSEAVGTLARAYGAARRSAAKRKGKYVTKSFRASALARAMEKIDRQLTVKLGRSPNAARGQLATTVVLDTRSSSRRLVLYAESDDGSIFRLTAATRGGPDLDEVAQGIPEANLPAPKPPTFAFTVDAVTLVGDATLVRLTLTVTEDDETYKYGVIVELTGAPAAPNGYLVSDLFVSALSSGAEP